MDDDDFNFFTLAFRVGRFIIDKEEIKRELNH